MNQSSQSTLPTTAPARKGFTADSLFESILERRSYLCVGLDTDPARIPQHLLEEEDPVFAFNKAIIDSTKDLCVAYKPNIAFYEALGPEGWKSLQRTIDYIPETHFTIADAKRGDIGNTSERYAKAFFDTLGFDSVTVAPYMGHDSVTPFLGFERKWVILLGLTSNPGSQDFQFLENEGKMFHEHVISKAMEWASPDELMLVCGATHPKEFGRLRNLCPEHFYLVPGVGAQGGDLDAISRNGMNKRCGLLVNSTRGIIYASQAEDFAEAARSEAEKLQKRMDELLREILDC